MYDTHYASLPVVLVPTTFCNSNRIQAYGSWRFPIFADFRSFNISGVSRLSNILSVSGIAMPFPVDPSRIKMNVLERIPSQNDMFKDISECLLEGPCLHVIPLYSKMLASTGQWSL